MRLENVQLRTASWVAGSHSNKRTFEWSKLSLECHSHLQWPELSIWHQYFSMLMIHDILHGHVALSFNKFFSFASSCTRTHSLTIYCKQSSINSYRYSFFVHSISLWNKIPECILCLLKRNSFKRQTHLILGLCFYFCSGCTPIGLSFCMTLSFD